LVHTANASTGENVRYSSIAIKNWVAKKNSTNTSCPGQICVQYEIVLDNYNWLGVDTQLIYAIAITSSASNIPSIDTYADYVEYGNAVVKIQRTASITPMMGDPSTIDTSLYDPDEFGVNWFKYNHYGNGCRMSHQGWMGFDKVTSYLVAENYFIFTLNDILLVVILIAVGVVVLLGGLYAYNRYQRQAEYTEIK